jgi:hypothetical protein
MSLDTFFRQRVVTMDGAVHALAPLAVLETRYSDANVKKWEDKAKKAEHVRDNAMKIFKAKTRYTTARNETRVANHSYGMLAIAQDRDARQVQKAITQFSQACHPERFLAVDDKIRNALAGGNNAG